MENEYYVYGYIRLDTNTYFYIGKGKDNRYLRLDNRKQHFMNIINKVPCVVEILYNNLTEEEAFQLEVDTIYDLVFNEGYSIDIKGIKKNTNGCHLVNCTWGGEGTSGLSVKQSQETIDKRVAKNIGQKRTDNQKEKLSIARNKRLDEHPEERKRLKTLHKSVPHSKESREKIRQKRLGTTPSQETIEKIRNTKLNKSQDEKDKENEKRMWTQGTHVKCIELDKVFPSKNQAIKYIKETYSILFNRISFNKCLNKEIDWYGEIEINGELVKLHWEYC